MQEALGGLADARSVPGNRSIGIRVLLLCESGHTEHRVFAKNIENGVDETLPVC